MSNKNKKNSVMDIDIEPYLRLGAKIIGWLFLLYLTFIFYTKTYNPAKRFVIKNTNYAYNEIQNIIQEEFKNNPSILDYKEVSKYSDDKICSLLASKLADGASSCSNNSMVSNYNFTFKKRKMEIYGLEKPPVDTEGGLAKDFYIDIDGVNKGENYTGKDVFPLRIYLKGIMSARVAPVNCNVQDMKDYGFTLPKTCGTGDGVDFMATNMPFGFDVVQIGADKGKDRTLNHDVPFLRADCAASGGELLAYDYCGEKQLTSLRTCDDEYVCSVSITKK